MSAQPSIAHYRIVSKLGEGGMGTVYLATDTKLNRDVAIKVLPDAFALDPARMERFDREARVLASLNHPNIAAIYGIEPGAIVMELVDGDHLRGPLPREIALDYAGQIADALEYAHDKGIIHRDLKPSNIKITREGQIKILDFGLAKLSDHMVPEPGATSPTLTASGTEAGVILGTPAYMAPEQACGQAVDRRTDIWAFGVVFWEMLAGRRMFDGASFSEIVAAVMRNEPDLGAVPRSVRPVIAACLEKDPRKRLRAAGDWRRLLINDVAGPPRRAARWPLIAAVVVALGAVVGAVFRPSIKTPAALIRVTEDPPVPLSLRAHGPTIALSPDGSRIVYLTATQVDRTALAIRRLDQRTPTDLPGTDYTDSMFFSADSRWVAYVTNEGLFKIGIDGGARMTICKTCTNIRGLAWSRDGNLIYGSLNGPLSRVPASGGEAVKLTKLENGELSHRWPALSPDESAAVFASSRGAGEDDALMALSLRNGERTDLRTPGNFPHFVSTGELLFMRAGSLYMLPLGRGLKPSGAPRRLLSDVASVLRTGGSQFTISDTGIAAYIRGYIDEDHLLLSWISADGKVSPAAAPADYVSPCLSLDGRKVAVRLETPNGPDYHVLDLERGAMTRITFDAKAKSYGAVWTPDGRFLVFTGEASGHGIYWVPSNGSSPPRKITETERGVSPESFSRDGKWLLLAGAGTISVAPAAIAADGVRLGKVESLFEGEAPRYSPDGRWIVYHFYQSGMSQVFARRFHGSEARYQISTGGGRNPVWSRGDQVFFMSNGIATVNCAEQAESLRCGAPRPWYQQRLSLSPMRSFDVAGDGRVLAVTPPIEANPGPSRVNFLFNFGASVLQAGGLQ